MAGQPPTIATSSVDTVSIQRLMNRLLLRPPYLDTNSYLSHTLDDFLLDDDTPSDDASDDALEIAADAPRQRRLAKEEAKLEKEIIRIIHSANAIDSLKANSGQSVAIGDHNICVGSHDDPGAEYRIWEWHGHIMFFDDEDGYSPEYIYGNYFERLPDAKKKVEEVEEEEDEEESVSSGLRDLIADPKDLPWSGSGRVLHRSSLNGGSSAARWLPCARSWYTGHITHFFCKCTCKSAEMTSLMAIDGLYNYSE